MTISIGTRLRHMLLGTFLMATAATTFAAEPAADKAAGPKALTSESFVQTAAVAGLFEVEAGKLAAERATRPEVKAFAQRMVTDHTKANDKLETLATAKKIAVPKQLDTKHTAKLTALKAKSGAAFDDAYVTDMIEGHHKAVSLFTAASSSQVIDAGLKDFAQETLPTLQDHNTKVQQLHH